MGVWLLKRVLSLPHSVGFNSTNEAERIACKAPFRVAVRPQWRGAQRTIGNEDFARAKPVERGKPGLSGR